MTTAAYPYTLDRTVTIQAPPERVFNFFTDSERWAKWWGPGSTIDAKPGGAVYVKHPGGVEASGSVVEVSAPKRFVFTYGFNSGDPIPPGASLVTITLERHPRGTRVVLKHEFAEQMARDAHVQGWRFQLSLFANVVADEVNANVARYVDLWFDAWSDPSDAARTLMMTEISTPELRFQDRYSNLEGLDDVLAHMTAAQRFMPGIRLKRTGAVRHCQGMVLADWVMTALDGAERGKGNNVFVLAPTGRIERVTGLASRE